ncbi:hypothetical protein LZ31DRAFT_608507 [Colletotrichum somersetense]|nr:hypothetical protein LZ31DRAFT_608507 [Colletotrichum somersetense]
MTFENIWFCNTVDDVAEATADMDSRAWTCVWNRPLGTLGVVGMVSCKKKAAVFNLKIIYMIAISCLLVKKPGTTLYTAQSPICWESQILYPSTVHCTRKQQVSLGLRSLQQ